MKILLIGATGTIGKAIFDQLNDNHQIISAGYKDGDVTVDLANSSSITAMFDTTGKVDAIICAAGVAKFGSLVEQSDEDYQLALNNKLMGQVNLIRIAKDHLNAKGSITITSGILSRKPFPGCASVAMVNGALESFVKAAALELENLRVNAIAPVFVKETMEMMGMDSTTGVSAADTSKAYIAALNGEMTGQTLDVPEYL